MGASLDGVQFIQYVSKKDYICLLKDTDLIYMLKFVHVQILIVKVIFKGGIRNNFFSFSFHMGKAWWGSTGGGGDETIS